MLTDANVLIRLLVIRFEDIPGDYQFYFQIILSSRQVYYEFSIAQM